jgi:hypothetical protein
MSACVTFPGSFEVIAIPEGEFSRWRILRASRHRPVNH